MGEFLGGIGLPGFGGLFALAALVGAVELVPHVDELAAGGCTGNGQSATHQ